MAHPEPSFIQALRFSWLMRFYDRTIGWGSWESRLRGTMIEEINPQPGQCILDIGSGTGTLAILLKQAQPGAVVAGLDPDGDIRAIAQKKAVAAGVEVTFFQGLARAPPNDSFFADDSLDCVASSLVFHHMTRDQKAGALTNSWRMLKPGGRLVIADWGRPHGWFMRLAFFPVQFLDGFETTSDSVEDRLMALMSEAGFHGVEEFQRVRTALGTLAFYRTHKPE